MRLTEQQCEDLRMQILESIYKLYIKEIEEQSKFLEDGDIEFNAQFAMRIDPDYLRDKGEYLRMQKILRQNQDAEEMIKNMSEEKILMLLRKK